MILVSIYDAAIIMRGLMTAKQNAVSFYLYLCINTVGILVSYLSFHKKLKGGQ
jgi:hypothetical protein